MFFSDFPEGLFRLRLCDGGDKRRVACTQGGLFWKRVPILVGQRGLNDRVGEVPKRGDSSNIGNMFNTGSHGLAHDVESTLPGDLKPLCVNLKSGSQGEMTNLEEIVELFVSGYGCRSVDDSGDTLKRIGEIALNQIFNDDDVDLVTMLGVSLPQRVGLSRPHDSNEAFSNGTNQNPLSVLTLGRGIPLSRGAPRHASR